MKKDDHKPATKKDLRSLATATKKDLQMLSVDLRREMATKDDLKTVAVALRHEMTRGFREFEKRNQQMMIHQFKVQNEQLVHDFNGIFKDRLEQHNDRITRLENHAGFRLLTV
ncbi:hypothetical protein HZA45_00035 [Candidatus Peregrinibacteria bacterium]|nr:hypothetical protein [Candidatus Peregrinibacteria bacterium]